MAETGTSGASRWTYRCPTRSASSSRRNANAPATQADPRRSGSRHDLRTLPRAHQAQRGLRHVQPRLRLGRRTHRLPPQAAVPTGTTPDSPLGDRQPIAPAVGLLGTGPTAGVAPADGGDSGDPHAELPRAGRGSPHKRHRSDGQSLAVGYALTSGTHSPCRYMQPTAFHYRRFGD
jgi:hypothetical protein